MYKIAILKWIGIFILILNVNTMKAQSNTSTLNVQQEKLASISALAATGKMDSLTDQLNKGLEAGLTINEIKAALVHLYAYCGFPRSLNALTTFMTVVEERQKTGKNDEVGQDASSLQANTNMLELGTKVQTELIGHPVSGGVMDFAPEIDRFLKEHLFGAIFANDVLTHQQREIVTVATLAAMDGVSSQLQGHLKFAMNTGLTISQLEGILDVIEKHISKEKADEGRAILSKL